MALKFIYSIAKGSAKAQMMTLAVLLIFILMIAELFSFVLLNISYGNIIQSSALSTSSSGIGQQLRNGADYFAYKSLQNAIYTLSSYESTPSLRKDNFIPNATFYIESLMVDGNIPGSNLYYTNDTNWTTGMMGGLTLQDYNTSLFHSLNSSTRVLLINETTPVLYQSSPTTLSVKYIENVVLNASGSIYNFTIPVSATIDLNGTSDILSAERGINLPIRFGSLGRLALPIGPSALSGNVLAYDYGTVLVLPSGASSCPTLPSASEYILAVPNAGTLGPCVNNFGGVITYSDASAPSVPYLVYSASSNVISLLHNGTNVLLYGPSLYTLNINNMINEAANGYFFTSPYAPSYLNRESGNLFTSSSSGLFTFSNYFEQVADFNPSLPSNIIVPYSNSISTTTGAFTISLWFESNLGSAATFNSELLDARSASANTFDLQLCGANGCGTGQGNLDAAGFYGHIGGGGSGWITTINYTYPISKGQWYNVIFSGNRNEWILYLNGAAVSSKTPGVILLALPNNGITIGGGYGANPFNGFISNVQIYNESITSGQAEQIYEAGIGGVPLSNSGLIEWLQLDGNARDNSGFGNNGQANNVNYSRPINYTRDAIAPADFKATTYPIPGLLSCTSSALCATNSGPALYTSSSPIAVGNDGLQAAYFKGTSYISTPLKTTTSFTWTAWFKEYSLTGQNLLIDSNANFAQLGVTGSGYAEFNLLNPAASNTCGSGSQAISPGVWYFVAASYSQASGESVCYLNGTGNSGTSVAVTTANGMVDISGSGAGLNYWNGEIADVKIYNASLSSTEIIDMYKEGIDGAPVQPQNLTGWWTLDGNANDTVSTYANPTTAYNVAYPQVVSNSTLPGPPSVVASSSFWQTLNMVPVFAQHQTIVTPTTGLGAITKYVTITLTNSQSQATPYPFQQMLDIDSQAFSSYINANWTNVEFTTGPGSTGSKLQAWIESNATNTATHTIVWVKLPVGIAADSNTMIYMDFMSSNVMSANGPTGEAPQLSCSVQSNTISGCGSNQYGEYDNGGKVFDFYDNFAGNVLNSNWTEVLTWKCSSGTCSEKIPNGQTLANNVTVATENGLYINDTGTGCSLFCNGALLNNTYSTSLPIIYDFYMQDDSTTFNMGYGRSTSGDTLTQSHSYSNAYFEIWSGGSAFVCGGGAGLGQWLLVSWATSSGEQSVYDYYSNICNLYAGEYTGSEPLNMSFYTVNGGSRIYHEYYQWIRARAYPPNLVMPSVSYSGIL